MRQLIPGKICLTCDVCCRFLDSASPLRPIFLKEERRGKFKNQIDNEGRVILKKHNSLYICPFFLHEKNICSIYRQRSLDCKLYPFIITYNENKDKIMLDLDTKCPFVKDKGAPQFLDYSKYLIETLENKRLANKISKNPSFIGECHRDYSPVSVLNRLTTRLIYTPQKRGYKKLSIRDKKIFDEQFKDSKDSYYSFISFYIWKEVMDIWWKKTNGKIDILLEQGGNLIEFDKTKKYKEYKYLRKDLVELRGNRFKHKRSSYNFFVKNYRYEYLPYKEGVEDECLVLFSKWRKQRTQKYQDLYYQRLIDDSFYAQKTAMENFQALGLLGRVVGVNGKISAYSFGVELNKDTFCILFEVTDLNIKGLSQFIFREFCKELSQYKYINLMDDSGLENLRRVKESYRPL